MGTNIASPGTVSDNKSCSGSIPANNIGDMITGMLSAFRRKDTSHSIVQDRLAPEAKAELYTMLKCLVDQACTVEYTKALAFSDAKAAVTEISEEATTKLAKKIDNIVHDAAKYKIPKILTEMEASNSYQNACAQLLMCDVLDQLRQLDIRGLVNEGAQLALKNVQSYATIHQGYIEGGNNNFMVATKAYDSLIENTTEKNHLNGEDAAVELIALSLFQAIWLWLLEKLYNKDDVSKGEELKKALSACA